MTASVLYNRPLRDGNLAATAVWGRTRTSADFSKENSYLLESTLRFMTRNSVWTRLENAGRSNELLAGEHELPPNFEEKPLTHVQAYTGGYDRDIDLLPGWRTAFGGQCTLYGVGQPLRPGYGAHPVAINLFLRLRPFSGRQR